MFIAKDDEAKIHPVLTNLALAYPQTGLVAGKLSPQVNVGEGEEDGTYFRFDKANLQGGQDDIRALGTRASSFDWTLDTDSYHAEEHSLEKAIDWREFKKFKKYIDLGRTTQEIMLEILLLNYEVRIGDLFCTADNYSSTHKTTLSGTSQWSDFTNSDPEDDIETAREIVALDAAEPNAIAIPVNIWRTVRRHPAIRSLMKEADSRQLTEDGFPVRLWGLQAFFPGARRNTVMPGGTESISRVWGNHVWLGVVNPRPSKKTMSFSYTLRTEGTRVETYEDKPIKSDVIRIQHQISAEKLVCANAGYLISSVIA